MNFLKKLVLLMAWSVPAQATEGLPLELLDCRVVFDLPPELVARGLGEEGRKLRHPFQLRFRVKGQTDYTGDFMAEWGGVGYSAPYPGSPPEGVRPQFFGSLLHAVSVKAGEVVELTHSDGATFSELLGEYDDCKDYIYFELFPKGTMGKELHPQGGWPKESCRRVLMENALFKRCKAERYEAHPKFFPAKEK